MLDRESIREILKNNVFKDISKYKKFLDFVSRGNINTLPFITQIQIYDKRNDVSIINTYEAWKKIGWQVKRGEHGISIFYGSKTIRVFDVSQTTNLRGPNIEKIAWTSIMADQAGVSKENVDKLISTNRKTLSNQIDSIHKNSFSNEPEKTIELLNLSEDSIRYTINTRLDLPTDYIKFKEFENITLEEFDYISDVLFSNIKIVFRNVYEKIKFNQDKISISTHKEEKEKVLDTKISKSYMVQMIYNRHSETMQGDVITKTNTETQIMEALSKFYPDRVIHECFFDNLSEAENYKNYCIENDFWFKTQKYSVGSKFCIEDRTYTIYSDKDNVIELLDASGEFPLFRTESKEDFNKLVGLDDSQSVNLNKYTFLQPKKEEVPEEYIRNVLLRGTGFVNGKQSVYNVFKNIDNSAERTKQIKNLYGQGGAGWPIKGYGLHGYDSVNSKGLTFQWRDEEGEKEGYIRWSKVEKELGKLIDEGKYLESDNLLIDESEIETDIYEVDEDRVVKDLEDDVETSGEMSDYEKKENVLLALENGSGLKVKFEKNLHAIGIIKTLEKTGLKANEIEKDIMKLYVGWGGLQEAFDKNNTLWATQYNKLKAALSEDEYKSAMSSVNTAFYTDKRVVVEVYNVIEKMGFSGGKILDPAMGTGRFFQYMPQQIKEKSELFGVEIDSVTGKIAKYIHNDAKIEIKGFENTTFNEDQFDLIVGNIPFGDFSVYDTKYNNGKYKIHDYFIVKSLDLLREGGILAIISSKGTLDKQDTRIRQVISSKADLAAAIRLPKGSFGETGATSDILFFVKRDLNRTLTHPEWIDVYDDINGVPYNAYFHNQPENLLGSMRYSSIYGGNSVTELVTDDKGSIFSNLSNLVENLQLDFFYKERENSNTIENSNIYEKQDVIPADFSTKPYTYKVIDDELYFRENDVMISYKALMIKQDKKYSEKTENKIKQMCEIKSILTQILFEMQQGCSDQKLLQMQKILGDTYDRFVKKNGYLNAKSNLSAFSDDIQSQLLASIEDTKVVIKNGIETTEYEKAKIFFERTIVMESEPSHFDNVYDALLASVNKYDSCNIEYIKELTDKSCEEIIEELIEKKAIFYDPAREYQGMERDNCFVIREMYLSGNVREKLVMAKNYKESHKDNDYTRYNILELENVMPQRIVYEDIKISIGSKMITLSDYEDFLIETLDINGYRDERPIRVLLEEHNSTYFIKDKHRYQNRFHCNTTYGTKRMPALEIFEALLNKRNIEVRDSYIDVDGKKKYKTNETETMLARNKSDEITIKFEQWLGESEERRMYYEDEYNRIFNSEVLQTYDGSHLTIPNMSAEIKLRDHQKNAITRAIRGNTLLAHPVGAGKTYVMAGACMKLKSVGAATKPLVVVPNPLVGQISQDFMKIFPTASILVTTDKDFETKSRQRFISKISVGNYDAVIMGHSQFGKISISPQRQREEFEEAIKNLEIAIEHSNERFTIKQLEAKKKNYSIKLEKLMNVESKDKQIYFEGLGIDALLVDEAHEFKNLDVQTKMSRVGGIQTASSQKALDLYMKVKYIRTIKGERNILFSTGTPLSNTICEMYTWQRYLAEENMTSKNITNFDDWASVFGEINTVWEVAPEGDKFQAKQKISKFRNIPELRKLFNIFADVKETSELNLPLPKLKDNKYQIVKGKPNEIQKKLQEDIVKRANAIRQGGVSPKEDNMLSICHDARLLAMDPRLLIPELSDGPSERTKLDDCIENVEKIYKETENTNGTQVIFSDIGTPNKTKKFSIYNYIKDELIKRGIPEEEICFIHDAADDKAKKQIHEDMRTGKKRIIIGSTKKLGTGTNIQNLLIAQHDLDVPWRPSDIEQREGRILRQGNQNSEVYIFRYVTEGTFDSYNWSVVENKQRFISQIMHSGDLSEREHEDISEDVMKYEELVALASGNPIMKERIEVDNEVRRLELLQRNYQRSKHETDKMVNEVYPTKITRLKENIKNIKEDILIAEANILNKENFRIDVKDKIYLDRHEAGVAIMSVVKNKDKMLLEQILGSYRGFELSCISKIESTVFGMERQLSFLGKSGIKYHLNITDATENGIVSRIENGINKLSSYLEEQEKRLDENVRSLAGAKQELEKPFKYEVRLIELRERQKEIQEELYKKDKTKDTQQPEEVINNGKIR